MAIGSQIYTECYEDLVTLRMRIYETYSFIYLFNKKREIILKKGKKVQKGTRIIEPSQ